MKLTPTSLRRSPSNNSSDFMYNIMLTLYYIKMILIRFVCSVFFFTWRVGMVHVLLCSAGDQRNPCAQGAGAPQHPSLPRLSERPLHPDTTCGWLRAVGCRGQHVKTAIPSRPSPPLAPPPSRTFSAPLESACPTVSLLVHLGQRGLGGYSQRTYGAMGEGNSLATFWGC